MRKIISIVVLGALFGTLFFSIFSLPKAKADILIVSANVDSKVSKEKSTVTTNVKEILADFSQRVIITVIVRDKNGNPSKGIKVHVTSNRGEVDQIVAIKASGGNLTPEEDAQPNITVTDENGIAIFRAASSVPGEVTFYTIADYIVELEPLNITFLPLPFPTDLTISVEVPTFINPQGKIVLFAPSKLTIDRTRLINTGTEIRISYALFLCIILVIILGPTFLLFTLFLFRKVRKAEAKELKYLEIERKLLEKISKEREILIQEIKAEEELARKAKADNTKEKSSS